MSDITEKATVKTMGGLFHREAKGQKHTLSMHTQLLGSPNLSV